MSLRIRRGTEAQRTGATFDLGEVAWTTDTNKLYVGDGINLGGKNILATSAGVGLVWNATTQRLDFNGNGTGIVNVQADNSPSLGGNLNLNNKNIVGTGNVNIVGTVTATQFVGIPNSPLVNDLAPSLGGNLNLNNRNIVGTGRIDYTGFARITTANAQDALEGMIRAEAYHSGTNVSLVNIHRGRGTPNSPLPVNSGDFLGGISFTGTTDTTGNHTPAGAIVAKSDGAVAVDTLPSQLLFLYFPSDGNPTTVGYSGKYGLGSPVAITVGSYADNTARDAVIPPGDAVEGMIVLNNGVFQGWNGTSWVTLG